MKLTNLLKQCANVRVKEHTGWGGSINYTYFITDGSSTIKLPEQDIYIEIVGTATKGTIGKLVAIHPYSTYTDGHFNIDKFEIEIDGRAKTSNIAQHQSRILDGAAETVWVRKVKKHAKVIIKNPVNKYKQELQKGDWIIGVGKHKILKIGRVSRWTKCNVWAVPPGSEPGDTKDEFLLDSISQTFLMPNDDHVGALTMAILKGYKGE